MIKMSSRLLLVFLTISLCIGIGVGYAVKDNGASASDSDEIGVQSDIDGFNNTVEQLQANVVTLRADLDTKTSEYNLLETLHQDVSDELADLKESMTSLEEEYQSLINDYQKLQENYKAFRDASDVDNVEEILSLQEQLSGLEEQVESLENEKFWQDVEIARLNKLMTPSPDHALVWSDVWADPETYGSPAWKGRDYGLQQKLEEIAQLYYSTHTYYEGETDCNDMAVDIWNMLLKQDIKSIIVVGNRDVVGETLEESNHAWLYALNAQGKVIYLEPTTGEVFYGKLPDGSTNPKAVPYRDGYGYDRPSDLRKDLKDWW